jgi:hypothetical protein
MGIGGSKAEVRESPTYATPTVRARIRFQYRAPLDDPPKLPRLIIGKLPSLGEEVG